MRAGETSRTHPRWWPLVLIAALTAAGLALVWSLPGLSGQERVIWTIKIGGVGVIFAWLWLLLLSRIARRKRIAWASLSALALAGAALSVRIEGVSGDLVPILRWRWSPRVDPSLLERNTSRPASEPIAIVSGPADYPGFLGPRRDGVVEGIRLERDWTARPPVLQWRKAVGRAWSSFAVAGGYAFTQEQRGEYETVVCYRLAGGEEIWSHADRARFESVIGGVGPRATPTFHEGVLYTMGATGILNALDAATGRRLWVRRTIEEHGAKLNEWGTSCSPLVAGDLVVVTVGGPGRLLVAYRKQDGTRVWAAGDDRAGYSSPFLATLAGKRQIVSFNASSVTGHEPASGQVLWSHPWPGKEPNVAQPLVAGADRLVVSSGYGVGAELIEIVRTDLGLSARRLWHSRALKSKFANLLLVEGVIYGLDDGIFTAVSRETGKRLWKGGRYGHGQLLRIGDLILVSTERGEIVLVEPDPAGLRELGRFQAVEGKTWNHPAFSAGLLLVRNDREAACWELPLVADGG